MESPTATVFGWSGRAVNRLARRTQSCHSHVVAVAQAPTGPVLDQRGLLNGFTKLPAPATVGRGGILPINGFNLGPPEGVTATGPRCPPRSAAFRS